MTGGGPDPLLVDAVAHVVVGDLDEPSLGAADVHHLRRVLRVRPGQPVTATDGRGRWRPCRFPADDDRLLIDGDVRVAPVAPFPVTIAFAVLKGDRNDLVVQKLTELGADRIVPMTTERTVVRWTPERAAAQAKRWERIVEEAVMQSRRTTVPIVEPLRTFAEVATRPGAKLAAPGGGPLVADSGPILIGPEGGWSETELERPLCRVGIGENVLRAETAAIVACALTVSGRAKAVGDSP